MSCNNYMTFEFKFLCSSMQICTNVAMPVFYVLWMAFVVPQLQSRIVATDLCPAKPKMFATWPFTKKFTDPVYRGGV